jgi:hypothetical protein
VDFFNQYSRIGSACRRQRRQAKIVAPDQLCESLFSHVVGLL